MGTYERPAMARIEADPAVATIVRRMYDRLDDVGRAMANRYRDEIVDYATLTEEILYGDVIVVSLDNLKSLLENLERGEVVTPEDLDDFREGAARRVHQGVPLESVLHAYRLWGEIVWQTILDAARPDDPQERDAALRIAGRVIAHINIVSTAVAQAYLDEAQGVWTDREVVRRDVLEALLAGKAAWEAVRRQASSLHLELEENYLVLLTRRHDGSSHDVSRPSFPERGAMRKVVDVAKSHLRPPSGSLLVGIRHDEVVALFPLAEPDLLYVAKEQGNAFAAAASHDGFSVGIGGWHPGPGGISTSYSEAKEALDIALKEQISGRAVAFDEVLLEHILSSSPRTERLLADAMLPLHDYDASHGTDLIPTLHAYIESGFNLTRSATSLCVHANTVVYRLRRIKEITGRDPHDPNDLILLSLGLKSLTMSQQVQARREISP